ncbi:enoyl-CoA hydratase-related protein [Nocardioides sp. NPDC127514]|uniref:enoyl-CoA hydratase/isomerase family protein n=1 Tax=unclassified Nocardioides TaxID=2615069 RepID=UPI00333376DB
MSELINDRVRWAIDGQVATMTLARPDAGNGFDLAMAEAIREAAKRVHNGSKDGTVRAAIIAAEGPAFSVGGDLQHFSSTAERDKEMDEVAGAIHDALRHLAVSDAPVITVVEGVAAGGGIGLALIGDIVLASPRAKFRMAYTAVGLSPDCGTSWIVPRLIGEARALDLALTNRVVSVKEAAEWGMVSRVVETDTLREAQTLARALAGGPFAALGSTKRLIRSSATASYSEHLDNEAASISELVASPNGIEGIDAFLAKREPKFT